MNTVNPEQLTQLRALLEDMAKQAAPGEALDRLQHMLGSVGRLEKILSARRVPDEILKQMIKEGADQWVADATGLSRQQVINLRVKWKIPGNPRGGSNPEWRRQRREWEGTWYPRLEAMGLLPAQETGAVLQANAEEGT